jgi:hypothetical protein
MTKAKETFQKGKCRNFRKVTCREAKVDVQWTKRRILVCQAKSPRYVRRMSAIGFSAHAPSELDQLREAYSSLNDVTRNLASAQKCLQKEDLRMAEHHLRAAEWHVGQAKQRIAAVGQSKPGCK